jgi:hypothetical protein
MTDEEREAIADAKKFKMMVCGLWFPIGFGFGIWAYTLLNGFLMGPLADEVSHILAATICVALWLMVEFLLVWWTVRE